MSSADPTKPNLCIVVFLILAAAHLIVLSLDARPDFNLSSSRLETGTGALPVLTETHLLSSGEYSAMSSRLETGTGALPVLTETHLLSSDLHYSSIIIECM
jgi:hypothetical protein